MDSSAGMRTNSLLTIKTIHPCSHEMPSCFLPRATTAPHSPRATSTTNSAQENGQHGAAGGFVSETTFLDKHMLALRKRIEKGRIAREVAGLVRGVASEHREGCMDWESMGGEI